MRSYCQCYKDNGNHDENDDDDYNNDANNDANNDSDDHSSARGALSVPRVSAAVLGPADILPAV